MIGMNFNPEDCIEIAKTHNGYAVKTYFKEVDGKGEEYTDSDIKLFEIEDKEDGDKEAVIKLLSYIAEEVCGITYDKFKPGNLNINFSKRGHKLE